MTEVDLAHRLDEANAAIEEHHRDFRALKALIREGLQIPTALDLNAREHKYRDLLMRMDGIVR